MLMMVFPKPAYVGWISPYTPSFPVGKDVRVEYGVSALSSAYAELDSGRYGDWAGGTTDRLLRPRGVVVYCCAISRNALTQRPSTLLNVLLPSMRLTAIRGSNRLAILI
jgi:hypothetical protein